MDNKQIDAFLKEIDGLKLASDTDFDYTRIPFNIPTLDELLGGGVPKKRFTIFEGPTNCGKSYLASQLVRSVQESGGIAGWIDTEMTLDKAWMTECGVDINKLVVYQGSTGEKAFEATRKLMQAGIDLAVIDSLAGVVPSNVLNEGFDYNPMAWQARFINQSMPRLVDELHHGTALVAINQVRSSMGPVSLDTMPGGMAQVFFAHMILQVRRAGWIEEGGKKSGFDMKVVVKKTKVSSEAFDEVTIPFRLSGGIDAMEIDLREAIEFKVIKKSGGWLKYGDKSHMGMNGIKAWFKENPKRFEEMKNELATKRSDGSGKSDSKDSDDDGDKVL